jgi:hypothetical protein
MPPPFHTSDCSIVSRAAAPGMRKPRRMVRFSIAASSKTRNCGNDCAGASIVTDASVRPGARTSKNPFPLAAHASSPVIVTPGCSVNFSNSTAPVIDEPGAKLMPQARPVFRPNTSGPPVTFSVAPAPLKYFASIVAAPALTVPALKIVPDSPPPIKVPAARSNAPAGRFRMVATPNEPRLSEPLVRATLLLLMRAPDSDTLPAMVRPADPAGMSNLPSQPPPDHTPGPWSTTLPRLPIVPPENVSAPSCFHKPAMERIPPDIVSSPFM